MIALFLFNPESPLSCVLTIHKLLRGCHVWKLLRQWKFSPQKPRRRARERNEADIERWRQKDLSTPEIKTADFLAGTFRKHKLFNAPQVGAAKVATHIALELLLASVADTWCDREQLIAEFQSVTVGYVGPHWGHVPVNPLVADALQLEWWTPDHRYTWFSNRWDFRTYILNYIRWAPWCG